MFDIPKKHNSLSEAELKKYLDVLEQKIDIEHIRNVEKRQLKVFGFEKTDRLPILISTRDDVGHKTAAGINWPEFSFGQMWKDYGAMLLNELRPVYESVLMKDDKVFTVRPNLSQIVVPSLFGATGVYPDDRIDSMPAVLSQLTHQHLSELNVDEIDYRSHWIINKYRDIINSWKEWLSDFPKLNESIHFSLPDLQGPFNLYFLLRGTEAYTDLIMEPGFTHKVMQKITSVLIDVTNYLSDFIDFSGVSYYWNYCYPGKIRNVDDNSIQLSADLYKEFVLPYNQMLAQQCDGGIHHYCGNGDHLLEQIISIKGHVGLNFGNPEMQDWDLVYNHALKHKLVLLYDKMILHDIYRELNQGVIMKAIVPSIDEGKRLLEAYAEQDN